MSANSSQKKRTHGQLPPVCNGPPRIDATSDRPSNLNNASCSPLNLSLADRSPFCSVAGNVSAPHQTHVNPPVNAFAGGGLFNVPSHFAQFPLSGLSPHSAAAAMYPHMLFNFLHAPWSMSSVPHPMHQHDWLLRQHQHQQSMQKVLEVSTPTQDLQSPTGFVHSPRSAFTAQRAAASDSSGSQQDRHSVGPASDTTAASPASRVANVASTPAPKPLSNFLMSSILDLSTHAHAAVGNDRRHDADTPVTTISVGTPSCPLEAEAAESLASPDAGTLDRSPGVPVPVLTHVGSTAKSDEEETANPEIVIKTEIEFVDLSSDVEVKHNPDVDDIKTRQYLFVDSPCVKLMPDIFGNRSAALDILAMLGYDQRDEAVSKNKKISQKKKTKRAQAEVRPYPIITRNALAEAEATAVPRAPRRSTDQIRPVVVTKSGGSTSTTRDGKAPNRDNLTKTGKLPHALLCILPTDSPPMSESETSSDEE